MLWGVSRSGDYNLGKGITNGVVPPRNACSGDVIVSPPADAQVCGGQYVESLNDGGGTPDIDSYPKQPFNFAGRTGTVVFDVSADSSGSHGAWPEFLITDEPVPGIERCISQCNLGEKGTATALNEIGFSLDNDQTGACPPKTGVGTIFMSKAGVYSQPAVQAFDNCLTPGSRTSMNHVEVHVSTTRIDVYGTDAGATTLHHLVGADLSLGFSQGLVWINDVHYNARKSVEVPCGSGSSCAVGTTYDHSFAWDNLGFDGPQTYRDLGFDVPLTDNHDDGCDQAGECVEVEEGYYLGNGPNVLTVSGVRWDQTPIAAKVVLNVVQTNATTLSVSVNGHAAVAHSLTSPFVTQTFSITVPVSDVHTGTNTLSFTSDNYGVQAANVSLILVAAARVP